MRRLVIAGAVALLVTGATATGGFAWTHAAPKHPGMYCAKYGPPFTGREGKLVFWCKTWLPGKNPKPRRHCLHYSHVPRGQHRHCEEWSA